MDNSKDPKYYCNKILEDIIFCIKHLENETVDSFNHDEVLNSAISFKFIQISESAKNLPDVFFQTYPCIPRQQINGMRNRIVHEYGSVNLDIIFNTVKEDFPKLAHDLAIIIKD